MSQQRQSPNFVPAHQGFPQAQSPATLCSIVYRSRAVSPFSGYELYELVKTAQSRNRAEAITGLMLYDESRFYQWLEGPYESVARVMNSIMSDRRHTDIEIVSDKPATTRQFADWTMRLATRGVRSIHSVHNVVVPSAETLTELLDHPDHAPEILEKFSSSLVPAALDIAARRGSNGPLRGEAGALLTDLITGTVIPELVARHAAQGRLGPWPSDTSVRALAELLIGPDDGSAVELLRTLQGEDGSVRRLYETLVEPAARSLGDLWGQDSCSEFDVTLGLGQLQRAMRELQQDVTPLAINSPFLPAVLIVPEPGEVHSLTAILESEALETAGWDPRREYPDSDEALQDLMAGSWFDALDLSLSTAFRREHWLPRVTKTIALARHASRNPALVVVVGGRIFAEDRTAGRLVGADASNATALDAERSIRTGMAKLQGD
jgi:methanogenic corrinoid protein MtbC1